MRKTVTNINIQTFVRRVYIIIQFLYLTVESETNLSRDLSLSKAGIRHCVVSLIP